MRCSVAMGTWLVATLAAFSCDSPPRRDVSTSTASESLRWSRRLQCRDVAQAKLAADEKEQESAARRGENRLLKFAPEYCYNQTLNTCICDEHWIGDLYEYRAVLDLLNGRKLVEFKTGMGGPANRQELQQQEVFEKERAKLFDGCAK